MKVEQIVNGIDLGRLDDTVDAITNNPEIGKFRFRVHNKWEGGAHCSTTIKDFYGACKEDTSRSKPFVLEADEPDVLLGKDHGPNATEAALHALASCLNATFIFQAAQDGIHVDQLELELEGDLDLNGFLGISDQIRNGFQQVRVTFKVKADASQEQITDLVQAAQNYSPVFDIFTNPVPVFARIEIQ